MWCEAPPFLFTFAYNSCVMCRSIFSHFALPLMLSLILSSCTKYGHTSIYVDQSGVAWLDTVPIPSDLSSPEERTEFRFLHYWDRLVFTDKTYTHDADFMSRIFDRYVSHLSEVDSAAAYPAVEDLMRRAQADSVTYYVFTHLADNLYECGDYESYLPFARAIIASDYPSEDDKMIPEYQLSLVLKNRPGTPATDFTYHTIDGMSSMSSLLGERPLILFFYNVSCHTCHRVMADIESSEILSTAISIGKLSVLTVDKMGPLDDWTSSLKDELPKGWIHGYNYTDLYDTDLYNIKGVPTIYLLDKDGTVLIREASVASLEQWCLVHLSL